MMALSRRVAKSSSLKSYLSRAKCVWLTLLFVMLLTLYSYFNYFLPFRSTSLSYFHQHVQSNASRSDRNFTDFFTTAINHESKFPQMVMAYADHTDRFASPQNVVPIELCKVLLTNTTTTEMSFSSLQRLMNSTNPHCAILTHFSSWEKGVVTQLGIRLKRDCHKLRTNTEAEVKRVKLKSQLNIWRSTKPWEHFALKFKQKSCNQIRDEFENNFYVSEVEKDFPIAYIFVVYTNAGQVLRLLKSIYRPHNLYCIHPDAKQGQAFTSFFKTVVKCLDNVFIASKPVRVYYGHISITDAQLHCMRDLMTYPQTRWKYVINLCGREVPLKTNREIVESLLKLKGYTAVNLLNMTELFWKKRFKYKVHINGKGNVKRTLQPQSKPPHEIKMYKSMNFIAASREFVSFLLSNPLSLEFHRYLSTVYIPEEHFYSSLYAHPQAKGARPPRDVVQRIDIPIVDKLIWINPQWQTESVMFHCPGQRIVHMICILTASDLGRIEELGVCSREPVFFFNKYFLEWDPTAMDCMEERLVKTNMDEYIRDCMPSHTLH